MSPEQIGLAATVGTTPEVADPRLTDPGRPPWSLKLVFGPTALRTADPLPLIVAWLEQLRVPRIVLSHLFVVVSELLTNAIDHGVLGLDSAIKDGPDGFSLYLRQRAERIDRLEAGLVSLEVDCTGHAVRVRVADSGRGFDHRALPSLQDVQRRRWGRGIALVRTLCSSVEYLGAGNQVEAHFPLFEACAYRGSAEPAAPVPNLRTGSEHLRPV